MKKTLPPLTPVDEAERIILSHIKPGRVATLEPSEALGLALATEVRAPADYPAFDRVIRDGFAVRSSDTPGSLTILEGEAAPAAPFKGEIKPRTAVYALTGAPLPKGADAVVRIEDCIVDGSTVTVPRIEPGAAITRRGSEVRAGALLYRPGDEITPIMVGALAFMGIPRVKVIRRPTAVVVVTGDEISSESSDFSIRDGDGPLVVSMLRRAGIEDVVLERSRDDFDTIVDLMRRHADRDILIFTGAVSMGARDSVPEALQRAGGTVVLHRIAQKPGRPMLFGTLGDALFFGLPGNPLSCAVGMHFYVLPAVRKRMGLPYQRSEVMAVLTGDIVSDTDRVLRSLVRLDESSHTAEPLEWHGSADLFNPATANGYVSVPPRGALRSGAPVRVEPLFRWTGPSPLREEGSQPESRGIRSERNELELHMVDVGSKPVTRRTAIAYARVDMERSTAEAIASGQVPKGDVLRTAEVAGIMAAKKTPDLVPLCHPLTLDGVDVRVEVIGSGVSVWTRVKNTGRTGVEMEALVAASAAALTVYDMIKGIDRSAVIREVMLLAKEGGKSGTFMRSAPIPEEWR